MVASQEPGGSRGVWWAECNDEAMRSMDGGRLRAAAGRCGPLWAAVDGGRWTAGDKPWVVGRGWWTVGDGWWVMVSKEYTADNGRRAVISDHRSGIGERWVIHARYIMRILLNIKYSWARTIIVVILFNIMWILFMMMMIVIVWFYYLQFSSSDFFKGEEENHCNLHDDHRKLHHPDDHDGHQNPIWNNHNK